MTVPLCLLAALLALVPSWLPGELAESLGRGSRLALAVVPFVALAGLPLAGRALPGRAPSDVAPSGRAGPRPLTRAWPVALAFALPVGALAAWLDLQNGWSAERLAVTAGVAALLILLLSEGSFRARGRPIHSLAWLALVPGAPALMAALVWVATAAEGRGALVRGFYHVSPVGWAVGRTRASEGPGSTEVLALVAALLLLLLALVPVREERA